MGHVPGKGARARLGTAACDEHGTVLSGQVSVLPAVACVVCPEQKVFAMQAYAAYTSSAVDTEVVFEAHCLPALAAAPHACQLHPSCWPHTTMLATLAGDSLHASALGDAEVVEALCGQALCSAAQSAGADTRSIRSRMQAETVSSGQPWVLAALPADGGGVTGVGPCTLARMLSGFDATCARLCKRYVRSRQCL